MEKADVVVSFVVPARLDQGWLLRHCQSLAPVTHAASSYILEPFLKLHPLSPQQLTWPACSMPHTSGLEWLCERPLLTIQ